MLLTIDNSESARTRLVDSGHAVCPQLHTMGPVGRWDNCHMPRAIYVVTRLMNMQMMACVSLIHARPVVNISVSRHTHCVLCLFVQYFWQWSHMRIALQDRKCARIRDTAIVKIIYQTAPLIPHKLESSLALTQPLSMLNSSQEDADGVSATHCIPSVPQLL